MCLQQIFVISSAYNKSTYTKSSCNMRDSESDEKVTGEQSNRAISTFMNVNIETLINSSQVNPATHEKDYTRLTGIYSKNVSFIEHLKIN